MGFLIEKGVLKEYTGADEELIVPDGVTAIGRNAFRGSVRLKRIQLPDGVITIGEGAFGGCSALAEINLPPSVCFIGGSTFNGTQIRPTQNGNFELLGNYYLHKYTGRDEGLTVPDGITAIGDKAFSGNFALKKLYLPSSVTSIGNWAFSNCGSLVLVQALGSLSKIGFGAFERCLQLKSLRVLGGVTEIWYEAFKGCSLLREISILGKVERIAYDAFHGGLYRRSVVLPQTPLSVVIEAELMDEAINGFLKNAALYTDKKIVEGYGRHVMKNRKKLLPLVFAGDTVEVIVLFAEYGKITAKNFETEFFAPAVKANATKCKAFLLDWRHKNLPKSSGDELKL